MLYFVLIVVASLPSTVSSVNEHCAALSSSSKVAGAPAMAVDSSKASITVTVRDAPNKSYYNRLQGCAKLNFTTKCDWQGSIIFDGLEEYTNYTIEGWIVNTMNEDGPRTRVVFATKPDSEWVI